MLPTISPPQIREGALAKTVIKGTLSMMPDDDRDFVERTESVTEKLYGQPLPIDKVADNFALYGLKKRVAALENFDSELRGEIDSSPHSLRRRVRLMELRRKMGGVHDALRKAKR